MSYADQVRHLLDETPEERAVRWFLLIHIPDAEITTVLPHFHRVLRPGGSLLLSFHVGDEPKLKTEGYGGHPMKVYVHRLGGILLARRHPQRSAPGHGQAKGY